MAKLKSPRLLMVIIACILSDYVIKAHAHICEVGRERNQYNEWKWVLPYPDLCECTKIIMAGMNTWTPVYPFDPVYVNSPLLLDNVGAIRKHYGLRCSTEALPHIESLRSTHVPLTNYLGSGDSSESNPTLTGTDTGTTINTLTNNEDATSTTASTSTDAGTALKSSTNDEYTTNAPAPTTTEAAADLRKRAEASVSIKSSTNNEDAASAAASTSTEAGASITSLTNNEDTTSAAASTSTGCGDYMGMENLQIPDQNISASGYKYNYYPQNGRLNAASAWWADQTAAPWIQADIGYQTYVSGVITQGGGTTFCCWVKQLKVSTFESNTNNLEIFVKDKDGSLKIFDGNSDKNSLKKSTFPDPVYARVVRITCLDRQNNAWMLRFEILGCTL